MTETRLLYVGAYTETIAFASGRVMQGGGRGIHVLRLDAQAGTIVEIDVLAGVRNPSYLAFDPTRRFLYAVNELKEHEGGFGGAVSAFAIDARTGKLTPLGAVPTHGTDPCHLAVDPSGRHVLVANYSSGHVTVLPVRADGSLGAASQVVELSGSSVNPERQAGPHAHAVVFDPSGRFLFVADLGADRILVYGFDAERGLLTPHDPPFVVTAPGAGPRQIKLHPDGRHAFVLNELGCSVTAYGYAAAGFAERLAYATLPADFAAWNTCAELQIAPSGRFLYASNRGHDSIAAFAIAPEDGALRFVGHTPTGGATPRNFDISPDGAFVAVANQDGGSVVLFRADAGTGALTPTGSVVAISNPVCVRFL